MTISNSRTMLGDTTYHHLVEALKIADVAAAAAEHLKNTILVYNSFNDVRS